MIIPDDTPLEISEGAWKLFVDPEALPGREGFPLYAQGMELVRRHREGAKRGERLAWQSRFRVFADGQLVVVILHTTWQGEPRENPVDVSPKVARWVPATATGPGFVTVMCLAEEWEGVVGNRLPRWPWPRDN